MRRSRVSVLHNRIHYKGLCERCPLEAGTALWNHLMFMLTEYTAAIGKILQALEANRSNRDCVNKETNR